MEIEINTGECCVGSDLSAGETKARHPSMEGAFADRLARAQEKENLLLDFLAGGEVSTTAEIAGILIRSSSETARRLLNKLTQRGLLKKDQIPSIGGSTNLYGISTLGLASAPNAHSDCPAYEMGRTSPQLLQHHLDLQLVRIALERYDDVTDWIPEKIIQVKASNSERRGRKFPDGYATDRRKLKFAIEVERNLKFGREWENTVISHFSAMHAGEYDMVAYFTDHLPQLWRQFRIIKDLELPMMPTIDFQNYWPNKFEIYSLKDFKARAYGEDAYVECYSMLEDENKKIVPRITIHRNNIP